MLGRAGGATTVLLELTSAHSSPFNGTATIQIAADQILSVASDVESQFPLADILLWIGDAHQRPLSECQTILQRISRLTDCILFAAEPPPFVSPDQAETTAALWPDQWSVHFADAGYTLVDLFRDELCQAPSVPDSLAQNLVMYVRGSRLKNHPTWQQHILPTPKRRVHPDRLCRHLHEATDSGQDLKLSPHRLAGGSIASYLADRWHGHPVKSSISVVITFHNEGAYAHRTLNGLELMCQSAAGHGLQVELLCALDNADPLTARIVSQHPLVTRLGRCLEMRHGDVGSSRNHAIDQASGDYVAILDGDDLYSPRWLALAHHRCRQFEWPVIVHPERIVSFGILKGMATVFDTTCGDLNEISPLTANRWIVTSFAPRSVYQCLPYTATDTGRTGFGFEDWHWNCETLAAGLHHVTAAETALFYRRRPDSMVMQQLGQRAIIRPTALARSPHYAGAYTPR
ncbi:glycosyltransferase [Verrucomicrobium sp. BvORR034]|uniref:glycosyltransferase family 2 protein n=1 Tax=Verrucomicrobium sp. BvORR034 TaxID=1396418 RepID=UPI000679E075|nr:glycosyltransferase [Verrucomicrobium sp. BvORR034]